MRANRRLSIGDLGTCEQQCARGVSEAHRDHQAWAHVSLVTARCGTLVYMATDFLIFSGTANPDLAAAVAHTLGVPIATSTVETVPRWRSDGAATRSRAAQGRLHHPADVTAGQRSSGRAFSVRRCVPSCLGGTRQRGPSRHALERLEPGWPVRWYREVDGRISQRMRCGWSGAQPY